MGRKKQPRKRGRAKRYIDKIFFCKKCGCLTNFIYGKEDPERLKAELCRFCWDEMKAKEER